MACRGAAETMRKGPWLEEEDTRLTSFVMSMGERRWDSIARVSGLRRSGKSCRLRWLNYLRPDLKHGQITPEEEYIILQLQERWGNKWSKIAARLPGRTDNEIKNYWRTHLRKQTQAQELEKLHRELDTVICTPDDQSVQTNSSYEGIEAGGMEEIENNFGEFDYGFVVSPYENRICDWISETINGQEYNVWDSWLRNPPTSSRDGDHLLDLLWDI